MSDKEPGVRVIKVVIMTDAILKRLKQSVYDCGTSFELTEEMVDDLCLLRAALAEKDAKIARLLSALKGMDAVATELFKQIGGKGVADWCVVNEGLICCTDLIESEGDGS